QSSSFTALGLTPPEVPVFAVAAAVAAPAAPATLSWQTTATASAGTISSSHFRLALGGDPRPDFVDAPRPDQGIRMCDPSRSRVPPVPVRPPGPPVTPL